MAGAGRGTTLARPVANFWPGALQMGRRLVASSALATLALATLALATLALATLALVAPLLASR